MMPSLSATHLRIIQVLSPKIGNDAAELEYTIYLNRWFISMLSLPTFVFIGLAVRLGSWLLGGLAIVAYCGMTVLMIRMFVLRHKYYVAASNWFGFRVSFRHPPHGVPNWRRRLREDQLAKLDVIYRSWHEAKIADERVAQAQQDL
jgi:hypothetical protein